MLSKDPGFADEYATSGHELIALILAEGKQLKEKSNSVTTGSASALTPIGQHGNHTFKGKISHQASQGCQYGGKSLHLKLKCHNCGHMGHIKPNCWRPGGGKAGQDP